MSTFFQYQLKAAYIGSYGGGDIFVDNSRDFNVGAALTAGSGTITADSTDSALIRALNNYWPLQFVGSTGIAPALTNAGVDLAVTSTLIVSANAMRDMLTLTNGSDAGMWIALAATGAVAGQGIFLGPNGGQWSESYSGPACGLHTAASGTKRCGVIEL